MKGLLDNPQALSMLISGMGLLGSKYEDQAEKWKQYGAQGLLQGAQFNADQNQIAKQNERLALQDDRQSVMDQRAGELHPLQMQQLQAQTNKLNNPPVKPPNFQMGVMGAPDGQMQKMFYNPQDPFGSMQNAGLPYTPKPNTYIDMVGNQNQSQIPTQTPSNNNRLPSINPVKNIRSSKVAEETKAKLLLRGQTKVDEERKAAEVDKQMINDIDRFMYLNKENYTGGGMAIPGASTIRSAFDEGFSEMQSLQDKMTPAMRQGMPGAASDRDVAMFKSATVGSSKPQESNTNVGLGLKAAKQNKIDRTDFRQWYLDQFGHLKGSETAWSEYLNKNDIFDHKAAKGSYGLNDSRLTWEQYFIKNMPQPTAPNDEENNNTSELERLKRQFNDTYGNQQ